MKSFKNIPVKFKPTPITIKEPYKPDLKSFETTDEFTAYFRANEDAFKEAPKNEDASTPDGASARWDNPKFLSANKLNRTYKIPGYRIRIINKGKDNEELTLVKDYYTRVSENNDTNEEPTDNNLNETIERIDIMDARINDIIERLNNIEEFLLQLKRR